MLAPCSLQTLVMNSTAPPTVSTDRAASSSISMPNSSSKLATSWTDWTLSAPRSAEKLSVLLILPASTPRTRAVTAFTRSSTDGHLYSPSVQFRCSIVRLQPKACALKPALRFYHRLAAFLNGLVAGGAVISKIASHIACSASVHWHLRRLMADLGRLVQFALAEALGHQAVEQPGEGRG